MSAPSKTQLTVLPELLAQQAQTRPGALAYGWLEDGVHQSAQLTWAELHARATALGAALLERIPRGSRVLLVLPAGLDVVVAGQAVFAAGLVGVPVAIPSVRRVEGAAKRIQRLADDSGAAAILSLREIADLLAGTGVAADLPWLLADEWPTDPAGAELTPPAADDLAYLQYTSGSTSMPRGVMLTHGAFATNLAMMIERCGMTAEDRVYTWVPPWHDMGLVGGILGGVHTGYPSWLASPATVVRRPIAWLRGISELGITGTGGPDFAYRMAAERARPGDLDGLDLSSLRLFYTGAEPVRPTTMRRFADTFAPAGFDPQVFLPCYGLAEITVGVTWSWSTDDPLLRTFDRAALGRGEAIPSGPQPDGDIREIVLPGDDAGVATVVACGEVSAERVAIVDPATRERLSDGRIGEIWARGADVAQGYWERPEQTVETFGGVLATDDALGAEAPRWLRTGDLGFVQDGQLFPTGRTKDVIIVAGVNYHAVDLESAAQEADPTLRVSPVAAFAEGGDAERAIVMIEAPSAELQPGPEADALADRIRRAIAVATDLTPARVVISQQHTLPRTTSGKVQRGRCREGLAYGVFPIVAEWPPAAAEGDPA